MAGMVLVYISPRLMLYTKWQEIEATKRIDYPFSSTMIRYGNPFLVASSFWRYSSVLALSLRRWLMIPGAAK